MSRWIGGHKVAKLIMEKIPMQTDQYRPSIAAVGISTKFAATVTISGESSPDIKDSLEPVAILLVSRVRKDV